MIAAFILGLVVGAGAGLLVAGLVAAAGRPSPLPGEHHAHGLHLVVGSHVRLYDQDAP
jgi:glucokinase